MNRVVLKRILDLMLYWVFCAVAGVGLLLEWRLPPGLGQRASVAGLTRHEWGEVHYWLGLTLVVGICAHLMLNMDWLVKIAAQRKAWALLCGMGVGVLLLTMPLVLPKETSGGGGKRGVHEEGSEKGVARGR